MGIKMKFIERKFCLDKLINVIGTPDIKTKKQQGFAKIQQVLYYKC